MPKSNWTIALRAPNINRYGVWTTGSGTRGYLIYDNEVTSGIVTGGGSKSGPLKKDDQVWSLEATPSGARFTMTEDAEMPWGIIGKILDALLSGMIGKNIEKILSNLNNVLKA